MKRTLCILVLIVACIGALAGCQCRHEWQAATCTAPKTCEICKATEGTAEDHAWVDATCAAPKTCSGCGLTEGEALPHTWVDATCAAPKTCSGCSLIDGAPLGHVWQAATCEAPKTCQVCALTDGEALGHSWTNATCTTPKTCATCNATDGDSLGHMWQDATTETPKTCKTCKITEGTRIITDSRFTTAACKPLFGSWSYRETYTAEDLGVTTETGSFKEIYTYTFHNDGTMTITYSVDDKATAKKLMEASIIEQIYDQYSNTADAEEFMQTYFNQSVAEYAHEYTEKYFGDESNFKIQMVYFVKGSNLCIAEAWDEDFTLAELSIKGDKLTLIDDSDERIELTRT